ncbi:MAG: hypothetical protein Q8L34_07035 [Candidatus Woesearchaeota archaeon]|nr:hypothetical protein [Candidatus Woesearchaeota archaeon]
MTQDDDKLNYSWKDRWNNHCKANAHRWFYKYSVDVSSGWLYYTTTYGLQELLAQTDHDTVYETRKIGMLVHAAVMRPIGWLRNKIAEKMHVTKESPLVDKMKVNALAIVPIQAFVYAGMLMGGMYRTGNWEWKSTATAWTIGMLTAVPHSLFYGPIQDRYRRFFGIAPAIKKTENPSLETYVQNP